MISQPARSRGTLPWPRAAGNGLKSGRSAKASPAGRMRSRTWGLARFSCWRDSRMPAIPARRNSGPQRAWSRLSTARDGCLPRIRRAGQTAMGQNRQQLGHNCLLTPSARSCLLGCAMNASEKQFSFTRAALSTGGRAESKFLSAKVKSGCSEGESPSSLGRTASCDRQTFCGCDFQGLGREWHWGILTSDVPSPICDTAVTRL